MDLDDVVKRIDVTKLERDYLKFPLKTINRSKERPSKSDFQFLYIESNLTSKQLQLYFNCSERFITNLIKDYNLHKDNEKKNQCRRNTCLEKYGVEFNTQYQPIKDKAVETNIERYGVKNPLQNADVQNKRTETILSKYQTVDQYYSERQQKIEAHNLKKYGVKNTFQLRDCVEQGMINKYGVNHPSKSEKVLQTKVDNSLAKRGVRNPSQDPEVKRKLRETNRNKYGVDCNLQDQSTYQAGEQTRLEKYGSRSFLQSQAYKQLINDDELWQSTRDKIRKTNINRYQNETFFGSNQHASMMSYIQQKTYDTKKKHNTFNTSKDELYIFNKIASKFSDVISQYKEPRYPFNCDFYIPSLDLFIEYQGTWTHGDHPFDQNNQCDREVVAQWEIKSKQVNCKGKQKSFYQRAIKTWTESDPHKRNVAANNKLNWIEFFTLDQFDQWFQSL